MNSKALVTFMLIILSTSVFAQRQDPYRPDAKKPKEIKGMKLSWNEEFNINGKPDVSVWQNEKGFVRNQGTGRYFYGLMACNMDIGNYKSMAIEWGSRFNGVLQD